MHAPEVRRCHWYACIDDIFSFICDIWNWMCSYLLFKVRFFSFWNLYLYRKLLFFVHSVYFFMFRFFFISSSALTRILYWIVKGKTGVSLFCLRLRYRMLITSQYWTCVFYFMQYHYCPYLSPNIASPGNCRTNKQSFLHHIPNCSQRCKF